MTVTPEVEALVLAELARRVKSRIDVTKAIVGTGYADGHREIIRSPLDQKRIGQIWRTDPDPKWTITNEPELLEHLREYPGNMERYYEIADETAAIEVLKEHAPHLLVEITRVRPDVIEAALEQSDATGEAAAPGITLVKKSGVLTVKPDDTAGPAIERLHNAGLIEWDGRPVVEAAS